MPKRKAVDKPPVKTVVHKKKYSLAQARAKILDSDSESLASSCGDLSDVESESGDDTDVYDYGSSTASSSTDLRATAVPVSSGSGRWSKQISYSADAFQPCHSPGVRDVPPDLSAETKVLEFLSLFISPDIWVRMTEMTNLRAAQTRHSQPKDYYASQWTDLTVDELKAFLGVRLSMEYGVIKRRLELYFGKKSGFLFDTPGYRNVFTRDRFLAIWKFLHYIDEEDQDIDKSDKLYKVRPLIDSLVPKFRERYVPSQDMSLDEGMIPTKNRLSIKQYMKSKPTKWGIKAFLLCESSTGYIYNVEIYTGKSDGLFVPELGATGSVVVRLASCIEGQNYRIFMDRFYNSPILSRYLLTMKLQSCGTIQVNRKDFPKQLIKRKKDMKRGDHDYLCCEKVSVVVWCDRAPIYFISTFHDPSAVSFVRRKNKDGSVTQVSCPQITTDYTTSMGGCDRNDQMTKLYKTRKHYRWPRRMIMKCLMWCCYNSYIIEGHFRPRKPTGKRLRTFYDFLDEVCMSLIGDFRSTSVLRRRSVTNLIEPRLQNVGNHHPERPVDATGNQTCAVCREKANRFAAAHPGTVAKNNPFKKAKTVFRCSSCLTYLCIREGSSCWLDFHSKVQYWR